MSRRAGKQGAAEEEADGDDDEDNNTAFNKIQLSKLAQRIKFPKSTESNAPDKGNVT